jgi:hypothetical protein
MTAGCVLNLNTGQIYCVYDDTFSTVSFPLRSNPFDVETFSEEAWQQILKTGSECHVQLEFDACGR